MHVSEHDILGETADDVRGRAQLEKLRVTRRGVDVRAAAWTPEECTRENLMARYGGGSYEIVGWGRDPKGHSGTVGRRTIQLPGEEKPLDGERAPASLPSPAPASGDSSSSGSGIGNTLAHLAAIVTPLVTKMFDASAADRRAHEERLRAAEERAAAAQQQSQQQIAMILAEQAKQSSAMMTAFLTRPATAPAPAQPGIADAFSAGVRVMAELADRSSKSDDGPGFAGVLGSIFESVPSLLQGFKAMGEFAKPPPPELPPSDETAEAAPTSGDEPAENEGELDHVGANGSAGPVPTGNA